MEFEFTQSNTTAKPPILKLENGNSWVSVPQTTQENDTSVTKMSIRITAEEKTNKKNDGKARSLLLMALPNEHQLTFTQYTDAKTIASSTESLDSIFNRLQKINTHVVVWMNKAEIETMSIDDLYNNFKIVEQSVKKSVGASSGAQNLAFMTASSTSSTNDQIHEDDLEAMYLKWQLSLLSMRVKRNQDNTRKHGNNKDTSSKAMLALDCVGFDWSDMAEEQVQTNMALMAFSDSEPATYKTGLATVEEQLITYRKNEVLFSEEVVVLKREVACKDYEINVLKSEFKKVKQEKEGNEFQIEKFNKASKDIDKLLGKFKDPKFKSYGFEDSKQESNIVCDKKSDASKENSNDSLVKEQVSEDTRQATTDDTKDFSDSENSEAHDLGT
ncbi:hypothetical protein Tco_1057091 [Tanacetum coccineum]|uniref:Uncharacterized protein n=1 Tax=Tanacetum coccineum TaxID=301880 RepID=A0ABQ5H4L0_9ASTR